MKFFVDTAKIEDIKKANDMGVICGVTTNPSLIAKEGGKSQEEVLKEMAAETRTIVMYEAPHRLVKTLKLLAERLGDRKVTVCRELTKRHETAFQSTLEGAVAYYEANDPKGECVIVIAGRSREEIRQEEKERWEDMSIEDHMEYYISQGVDRKEAMKKVAKDRGVQKREIYNYLEKQKS